MGIHAIYCPEPGPNGSHRELGETVELQGRQDTGSRAKVCLRRHT